jgi:hypothetical protein
MAGKMISVAMVPPVRPPITARPSGAVCEPDSPRPIAIGNIPAIIAQPVIRIGRRRLAAPETAASGTWAPSIRSRPAKVTSRIALATATNALLGITDDAVKSLAEIIHEIDLRDGRYHRSEIEGIELVLKGWRQSDLADAELEARGILFFDGLHVALAAGGKA